MTLKQLSALLAVLLFIVVDTTAQELKFPDLDKSPMDAAHYPRRAAFKNYLSEDDADRTQQIKVLYSQPQKKDRDIFGGLVPFGETWRLGANEATEVTFSQPVEIGGTFINAGTYIMNADINEKDWTIRLSTERFVAGTSNLDESKIIAKGKAMVSSVANSREAFTIGFQKMDEGNVNMIFEWDQTRATLPINLYPAMLAADLDKSPMDLVQYPVNSRFQNFREPKEDPQIRVVYSRPQKKDRDVWGDLKKVGDMWRVGANETTTITFFNDVVINGTTVKKGQYGLFAKINDGSWDFIIHKNVQSWGHPNHNEEDNVLTVTAKTAATPQTVESMTILLEKNGDNQVDLVVAWDDLMAKFPITLK